MNRRRGLLILILGALIVAGALVGALLEIGRSGASAPGFPGGPYRGSEPPPGIRVANVTLPSYRGGMRKPNRRSLAVAGAVLLALALAAAIPRLFSSHGLSAAELKQADIARVAQGTLRERFALLSQQHTNKCSLAGVDLQKIAVHGRLQGSCCNAMVYGHYAQQVKGLRTYAAVSEIAADPYDVPVSLAKRLIGYSNSIELFPAQQAVYDHAVKLSDEHGPCCCHCWRWKAFEGQANKLIARRGYTAAQIANVWDVEDGCGGSA